MFEPGLVYRHQSTLDVDLYVVRVEDHQDLFLLTVKYWNRNSHCFQPDSRTTDNVVVRKSQLENWSQV